MTNYIH